MRAIDADALIAWIKGSQQMTSKMKCVIAKIETMPGAVSVVHGEWLPFEYGDDTWHKCSVCGIADKYKGSMPRPSGTIAEWEYVRNYCPNCGAKMKGAEDE